MKDWIKNLIISVRGLKTGDLEAGDIVLVTDLGGVYTTYDKMALEMGLTNYKRSSYPDTKEHYKILSIRRHHNYPFLILAGIENRMNEQYILGIRELERL